MIVRQLDYVSLARLAATNTMVEKYIIDLPWYKLVVEYCQEALRIMAKLQAPHTVGRLNAAFADPICSFCQENMGRWIYVPECSRCCERCLYDKFMWAKGHGGDIAECHKIDEIIFSGPQTRMARIIQGHKKHSLHVHIRGIPRSLSAPFLFFDREAERIDFGRRCRACGHSYRDYTYSLIESSSESSSESFIEDLLLPSPSEREDQHVISTLLKRASERVFSSSQQLLRRVRDGECRTARDFWVQNL